MKSALDKAKVWASHSYFDEKDRQEIQGLIDSKNTNEIEERFYKDLAFGTGGMRSILGVGSNRMNKYNIRKATQALATTILEQNVSSPKAVISYDSRHFSFEFAKEAASVFAGNGIKALIFDRLNPVPLCSFAIRHHKAQAGVMVTASHNPPEYNGYKVFWSDGAQVTPPYDQKIINEFGNIEDLETIKYLDFEAGEAQEMIQWIGKETETKYFERIKEKCLNLKLLQEKGNNLKIAYTAIHGTGLIPCTTALNNIGLTNLVTVKEQDEPNGDFPTVPFPNPEEPDALKMVVDLMRKEKADLALGTDPDTDRVGLALFDKNGETKYLNGNQIGTLMLHYILSQLKERNEIPPKAYFVKTIVTSPLQEKIAASFGVEVENTLTGFKWICGRMNEIEQEEPDRNFIFGTEESFGYLNHENVRDKDGVSSIALLCEIALFYKEKEMSLINALDKIYEEYGFAYESLLSLTYKGRDGADKIKKIMNHFRKTSGTLPGKLLDETIEIADDYSEQISKDKNGTKPLTLPKSNVLGFHFASGNKVFLRPSGTEPKIKFYIMIQETEGSLEIKKENALAKTKKFTQFLEKECEAI